ncbi:Chaplin OS=Streptomyces alboniger OX=132473 GN=CP975_18790 PE=4 SV=1 [Streptomyces alboniger]
MLSAAAATSILSVRHLRVRRLAANGQAQDSPGFLAGNSVQAPLEVPVNVCGNSADAAAALNPSFGNKCGNASDRPEPHPHHGQHSHHGQPPRHGEQHGGQHGGQPAQQGGGHEAGSGAQPGQHHAEPAHHAPQSPPKEPRAHDEEASGTSGSAAEGGTANSPGVGGGNNAEAPVDVPVKACGNHVGLVSLLSPVFGNGCDAPAPEPPAPHHPEKPAPHEPAPHEPAPHHPEPHAPAPEGPGTEPRAMPAPGPSVVSSSTTAAVKHAPRTVRADDPVGTRARLADTGADQSLYGATAASAALLLGGAILYRRGRTASANR